MNGNEQRGRGEERGGSKHRGNDGNGNNYSRLPHAATTIESSDQSCMMKVTLRLNCDGYRDKTIILNSTQVCVLSCASCDDKQNTTSRIRRCCEIVASTDVFLFFHFSQKQKDKRVCAFL